jgi:uncharacterized protein YllA (UPF0747 family)
MNLPQSSLTPAVVIPNQTQADLHKEWLATLMALAPFTRTDALDLVMERLADAVDKYLLQPIESVNADDTEQLLKAQGQAELIKRQETTMHVFALCEKE